MKQAYKSMALFLGLTAVLSAANCYILIAHSFPVTWFWMWCPGVAAIITARVYRSQGILLGVRRFVGKDVLLGIGFPAVYFGVSYGLYWLASGSFSPGHNDFFANPWLILLAVPINLVAALGEEIGWRGFLAPKLMSLMGFGGAGVVSGLVWAVWHFPMMIAWAGGEGAPPVWYAMLIFTIQCVAISILMLLLRLSGSVWPAVFFHAVHNILDQVFLGPSTAGLNPYIVGEAGLLTTGFLLACLGAALLWRHKRNEAVKARV